MIFEFLDNFANNEDVFLPTMIAFAIIVIVLIKNLTRMVVGVSAERTRREIAAYIAEGSMTPEQGERLLASGNRPNRCG